MLEKLTSRKFIMTLVGFLGSLGVSIAGLGTSNEIVAAVGIICAVFSTALYTVVEGKIDIEKEEMEEEL